MRHVFRICCFSCLGLLILVQAFPPVMTTGTGEEASWGIALAEAHIHGLQFGKDIVFTYGPLSFLTIAPETPQTFVGIFTFASLMALVSAAIAIACAADESRGLGQRMVFILALAVAFAAMCGWDWTPLNLTIMTAWALPVFRRGKPASLAALALGVLSGVATLVKFQYAFMAFGGLLLVSTRALRQDGDSAATKFTEVLTFLGGLLIAYGWPFAATDYGLPVASTLAVSAVASAIVGAILRQIKAATFSALCVILALPMGLAPSARSFAVTSLELSSGYSAAMSISGNTLLLVLAFLIAAVVVVSVLANLRLVTTPVAVALGVAMFVAFKEGFVRQDAHVLFFFEIAVCVLAVVTYLSAGGRRFIVAALCLGAALTVLELVNFSADLPDLIGATISPGAITQRAGSLFERVRSAKSVAEEAAQGLSGDVLPEKVRREIGMQSVNTLPWETGAVFANGFVWDPEPAFLSYLAYTPTLDVMNAMHLEARGASRLLMQWDDIDGRYPLWDEPLTDRMILCSYRVDKQYRAPVVSRNGSSFLLLSRADNRCAKSVQSAPGRYAWREKIAVPSGDRLTVVKLSINYSFLGRMAKLFYRIPEIFIKAYDQRGQVLQYRIVGETTADGLLVNPFPQNLPELAAALSKEDVSESVHALSVETDKPYFFQPAIGVTFESLPYH